MGLKARDYNVVSVLINKDLFSIVAEAVYDASHTHVGHETVKT